MPRAAPKRSLPLNAQTILLVVGVFLLSSILWAQATRIVLPWQEQPLRVWMLNVGQGDAFFIEFPTGEQMLIDGGRDDALLAKLGSLLLPWDRTIDSILMTHPDADHVTGFISLLDRYHIDHIYETGAIATTPQGRMIVERVENEAAIVSLLSAGDVIEIGEVVLSVVWPQETYEGTEVGDRNNTSLVFLLTYGDTSILFTGDAEEEAEQGFMGDVGNMDVLKVGHHGSLSSTSWDLLEILRPEIALVSAGEDNPYGHPHPIIMSRLEQWKTAVFRTDFQGDILLTSYGGEPKVQSSPLPF